MSDKTTERRCGRASERAGFRPGIRGVSLPAVAVIVAVTLALSGPAHVSLAAPSTPADPETWPFAPRPLPNPVPDRLPEGMSWCAYPARAGQSPTSKTSSRAKAAVITIDEIEPNSEVYEPQFISISSAIGAELDVTVKGSIEPGDDIDYYRFFANKGDIIGLVVTTNRDEEDITPYAGLDPMSAVCDMTGEPYLENDNDFGLSMYYPTDSPLPRISTPFYPGYRWDSVLSWVAPESGDYLIRVRSFEYSRNGDYELKVVARRPSFENQAVGAAQIIYLDFDGVEDFNTYETFGTYWYLTSLSPLKYFLPDWDLTYEDESAVVDALLARFQQHFDELRTASLNGDRDSDYIDGHFDYDLRNSRDHTDPWGQPNVSRVICGGTVYELGILTIGIAEWIDPGNFSREDTAVVLLDYLSDPDPADLNSVNSVPLAGNVTKAEAVGWTIGTIAAHEAVHYLGLWHTDNQNDVPCLIDQGGNPISDAAGAGQDGILGTADDEILRLVPDEYIENEAVATGLEYTDVIIAFGLATGKNLDIEPPVIPPEIPKVSISAMPKIGQAPLTINFAGGGVDPTGGQFVVFNWNFGDQATGTGAWVSHTYTKPGTYFVTLAGVTNNAVTAQATTEVTVLSQPNELPTIAIVATPSKGTAPLLVLFEADAEDPDGTVIGYAWDFGDGQSGSGQTIDHVYVLPGNYVVTLTVTDNLGGVSQATALITVKNASGTAGAVVPGGTGDSALNLPTLDNCGAGTTSSLVGTMTIMLGVMAIRRRW